MTLLALGLNHHTAPVAVRERATIAEEHLDDALRALRGLDAVNEAAIVSTCNRTEVYCGVSDANPAPILAWMSEWMRLDADTLARGVVNLGEAASGGPPAAAPAGGRAADDPAWLFGHSDLDAVVHLMRVASGLDSMVLGEPQILGQIKRAYRDASDAGTVGAELSPLFQTAFSVAKQVRTETDIGTNPVSVAFAAVSLARQIFADFSKHTALLVGAGETVQLAARHLRARRHRPAADRQPHDRARGGPGRRGRRRAAGAGRHLRAHGRGRSRDRLHRVAAADHRPRHRGPRPEGSPLPTDADRRHRRAARRRARGGGPRQRVPLHRRRPQERHRREPPLARGRRRRGRGHRRPTQARRFMQRLGALGASDTYPRVPRPRRDDPRERDAARAQAAAGRQAAGGRARAALQAARQQAHAHPPPPASARRPSTARTPSWRTPAGCSGSRCRAGEGLHPDAAGERGRAGARRSAC